MQDYLGDYSVQYFLNAPFEEDEMLQRITDLRDDLKENKSNICHEDQDMSFTKIEELNEELDQQTK